MTWFKIDDGFHCHPKAVAAGNAAIGLWTRLGAYSSDQLTDGFIPAAIAKGYGTKAELNRLADRAVNLLEPGAHPTYGDGYWIHDYHDYNPTAEKVRADRAEAAERQRRSREQRAESRRTSHNLSRRDSHDPVSHDPDPTRPEEEPLTSETSFTSDIHRHGEIDTAVANLAHRFKP